MFRRWPFLLPMLGVACSLFEPRASQAPDDDENQLDWRPPISPSAVLDNLHAAVEALEQNRYPELLAGEGWTRQFLFVPDAPSGSVSWGRDEESAAWQRLCDHQEALQLSPLLELVRTDSLTSGDSALWVADYLLEIPPGQSTSRQRFSGTMRLALSRQADTGDWAIHRWEDLGSDSLPAWTQLKQAFLWP